MRRLRVSGGWGVYWMNCRLAGLYVEPPVRDLGWEKVNDWDAGCCY